MISFPELILSNMTLHMSSMTLGGSYDVLTTPPKFNEKATTKLINDTLQLCEISGEEKKTNPLDWSIEERYAYLGHYLLSISKGDFKIGDGKYFDYFMPDSRPVEPSVYAGNIEGDDWYIRPMTGRMAESMERVYGDNNIAIKDELYWLLSRMAFQLHREQDDFPENENGKYDLFLAKRLHIFKQYSEDAIIALNIAFNSSLPKITRLFRISTNKTGLAVLPKGDSGLPPIRFLAANCTRRWTREIIGEHS